MVKTQLYSILPIIFTSLVLVITPPSGAQTNYPNKTYGEFLLISKESAAKKNKKSKKSKKKKTKSKKKSKKRKSSKLIKRKKSMFGGALDVGALFFKPSYGLDIWVQLEEYFHIGLWAFMGRETINAKKNETQYLQESMIVNYKLVGLNSRFFILDYLHICSALNYAITNGEYGYTGLYENIQDTFVSFKAKTIVLSAGIGTQWPFLSRGIFGVEWFGGGVILKNSLSVGQDLVVEGENVSSRMMWFTNMTIDERIKAEFENNFKFYYILIRLGYQI